MWNCVVLNFEKKPQAKANLAYCHLLFSFFLYAMEWFKLGIFRAQQQVHVIWFWLELMIFLWTKDPLNSQTLRERVLKIVGVEARLRILPVTSVPRYLWGCGGSIYDKQILQISNFPLARGSSLPSKYDDFEANLPIKWPPFTHPMMLDLILKASVHQSVFARGTGFKQKLPWISRDKTPQIDMWKLPIQDRWNPGANIDD